jgi:O-acetyl-ADP-ribose deacetylase (regulator of RNase III)
MSCKIEANSGDNESPSSKKSDSDNKLNQENKDSEENIITDGDAEEKAELNDKENDDAIAIMDSSQAPDILASIPGLIEKSAWSKVEPTASIADLKNDIETGDGKRHDPKIEASAEAEIGGIVRSVSVVFGNLVKEKVGAIVNAANVNLVGSAGVAAAIQNNAGPKLVKEARKYLKENGLDKFVTGSAMVTNAYDLNAKLGINFVVHTVGPAGKSNPKNDLLLYSAYYNSLLKASEYGARVISFPSISTGIFGFPLDVASDLFFKAVFEFFKNNPDSSIISVRSTNFDIKTVAVFLDKFRILFP